MKYVAPLFRVEFKTAPEKIVFKGNGQHTTDSFHIPSSQWTIRYWVLNPDPDPFKFSLKVYATGEEFWTTVGPSVTRDGVHMLNVQEGPGDFYLNIMTKCDVEWRIAVTFHPYFP
jgi:hypothetical protein